MLLTLATGTSPAAAQSPSLTASGALRALGLDVDVTEYRFPVSGWSPQDAVSRLSFNGPMGLNGERAHGLTSFHLQTRWIPVRQTNGCVAQRVRVTATVRIYMPFWTGLDDAAGDERARWRAFEIPLRRHEYTHRDITLQTATELALSIRAAHASNCPRLVRVVTGIMNRARASLERENAELDAKLRMRP